MIARLRGLVGRGSHGSPAPVVASTGLVARLEGGPAPDTYEAQLEARYAALAERREAGLLTDREYCEFIDRSDW